MLPYSLSLYAARMRRRHTPSEASTGYEPKRLSDGPGAHPQGRGKVAQTPEKDALCEFVTAGGRRGQAPGRLHQRVHDPVNTRTVGGLPCPVNNQTGEAHDLPKTVDGLPCPANNQTGEAHDLYKNVDGLPCPADSQTGGVEYPMQTLYLQTTLSLTKPTSHTSIQDQRVGRVKGLANIRRQEVRVQLSNRLQRVCKDVGNAQGSKAPRQPGSAPVTYLCGDREVPGGRACTIEGRAPKPPVLSKQCKKRTHRSDREEKIERTHRSEREQKSERTHRSEREHKNERTHRSEREEKSERTHRSEREQKGKRTHRSERKRKNERTRRSEREEKSERTHRSDREQIKGERTHRSEREQVNERARRGECEQSYAATPTSTAAELTPPEQSKSKEHGRLRALNAASERDSERASALASEQACVSTEHTRELVSECAQLSAPVHERARVSSAHMRALVSEGAQLLATVSKQASGQASQYGRARAPDAASTRDELPPLPPSLTVPPSLPPPPEQPLPPSLPLPLSMSLQPPSLQLPPSLSLPPSLPLSKNCSRHMHGQRSPEYCIAPVTSHTLKLSQGLDKDLIKFNWSADVSVTRNNEQARVSNGHTREIVSECMHAQLLSNKAGLCHVPEPPVVEWPQKRMVQLPAKEEQLKAPVDENGGQKQPKEEQLKGPVDENGGQKQPKEEQLKAPVDDNSGQKQPIKEQLEAPVDDNGGQKQPKPPAQDQHAHIEREHGHHARRQESGRVPDAPNGLDSERASAADHLLGQNAANVVPATILSGENVRAWLSGFEWTQSGLELYKYNWLDDVLVDEIVRGREHWRAGTSFPNIHRRAEEPEPEPAPEPEPERQRGRGDGREARTEAERDTRAERAEDRTQPQTRSQPQSVQPPAMPLALDSVPPDANATAQRWPFLTRTAAETPLHASDASDNENIDDDDMPESEVDAPHDSGEPTNKGNTANQDHSLSGLYEMIKRQAATHRIEMGKQQRRADLAEAQARQDRFANDTKLNALLSQQRIEHTRTAALEANLSAMITEMKGLTQTMTTMRGQLESAALGANGPLSTPENETETVCLVKAQQASEHDQDDDKQGQTGIIEPDSDGKDEHGDQTTNESDSSRSCHRSQANNSNARGRQKAKTSKRTTDAEGKPRARKKLDKLKKMDCLDFIVSGQCDRGEACWFMHRSLAEAKKALEKGKAQAASVRGQTANKQPKAQESSRGICHGWRDSGECKFGRDCKFDHPEKANSARRGGSADKRTTMKDLRKTRDLDMVRITDPGLPWDGMLAQVVALGKRLVNSGAAHGAVRWRYTHGAVRISRGGPGPTPKPTDHHITR